MATSPAAGCGHGFQDAATLILRPPRGQGRTALRAACRNRPSPVMAQREPDDETNCYEVDVQPGEDVIVVAPRPTDRCPCLIRSPEDGSAQSPDGGHEQREEHGDGNE